MSAVAATRPTLDEVADAWLEAWPAALTVWSRFTRLRPPRLCRTREESRAEGLEGSFAMIRLVDQAIIVSLPDVLASGVEDYGLEILAHEIGHHILAPANLTDLARMIARMRWSLPTLEDQAGMVANLYTDLLINDRLQRIEELRIADVYRAIAPADVPVAKRASKPGQEVEVEAKAKATAETDDQPPDLPRGALWTVYTRIFEVLWNLPRRSLGGGETDARMEGDAWLGARLIRSFARHWLDGSGRFAALMLPYLLADRALADTWTRKLYDTRDAAVGGKVQGLSVEDPEERAGAIHPATEKEPADEAAEASAQGATERGAGQAREPFEYGEILRSAGLVLSDHEVAVRYYREQALPHLVPFPSRPAPRSTEPLPEGLESWDLGHPLDDIDWLQTLMVSPRVVPGTTTVRRVYGTTEGRERAPTPLDLDLYVDSSGSMVNPQRHVSYPALAGAILCLSALRVGARVQATLWSGKNQFETTDGFVRDEHAVLRVLTGYFGGGTAFPIHILRDTYRKPEAQRRPTHVLILSDDGVSTLFSQDEEGTSGWVVAQEALARAGGGGTMVLQLHERWEEPVKVSNWLADAMREIRRARDEGGWDVHRVASWQDLVDFAKAFSRRTYAANEVAAREGARSA